MVGDTGIRRLAEAHVCVVGLGAVGGHAVEALARSGVGRLRLVDFDHIEESNVNRQLYALTSTLGRLKVDVAAERVADISPTYVVQGLPIFCDRRTMPEVLEGPPTVVVDAIDVLGAKVELLASARQGGIPIVSAMGAAMRTDPAHVRTGPLERTTVCPLARRVRNRLRGRGIDADMLCVYSTEPVNRELLGEKRQEAWGGTRRTLSSLPTLTGIFGLALANLALAEILGDAWPGTRSRS